MKYEKIDKYFPATSTELILEFLSDDDGKFHLRRDAFEAYLSGVADPTGTNSRLFSDSLIELLFDRNYVKSHKWAGSK